MMLLPMGSPPGKGEAPELLAQSEAPNQNITKLFSLNEAHLVKPEYPSAKYLPGRVLGLLLAGARITHLDSLRMLGHARLADSIWKLRRLGWPVMMHEQIVSTSDAGRPANIGIYYFDPEFIEQAGELGQRFAVECARAEAERRAA